MHQLHFTRFLILAIWVSFLFMVTSCKEENDSIITDARLGNNHPFTDNCHQNRTEFLGTPRTYNTMLEAGMENAYSRIPLGVHYRMDCVEGIRLGYLAAARVSALS